MTQAKNYLASKTHRFDGVGCRIAVGLWATCCLAIGVVPTAQGQPPQTLSPMSLTRAVMCEEVRDRQPVRPTVLFSISLGRAHCFTTFTNIPEKTLIYHRWYRRDVLNTTIRLAVNPPIWATYSNIQLRESDKGPWRVEITDDRGTHYETLRFSVTD